jgi:hypothetical protein
MTDVARDSHGRTAPRNRMRRGGSGGRETADRGPEPVSRGSGDGTGTSDFRSPAAGWTRSSRRTTRPPRPRRLATALLGALARRTAMDGQPPRVPHRACRDEHAPRKQNDDLRHRPRSVHDRRGPQRKPQERRNPGCGTAVLQPPAHEHPRDDQRRDTDHRRLQRGDRRECRNSRAHQRHRRTVHHARKGRGYFRDRPPLPRLVHPACPARPWRSPQPGPPRHTPRRKMG